jgi:hypothetical protein
MTLQLTFAEWDRVHREFAAAVSALAASDVAALEESMSVLWTYEGLRARRKVNPDMGTAELAPIPDSIRAVANDLVHRLTPEPLVEQPQSTPRDASSEDAGTADRQ